MGHMVPHTQALIRQGGEPAWYYLLCSCQTIPDILGTPVPSHVSDIVFCSVSIGELVIVLDNVIDQSLPSHHPRVQLAGHSDDHHRQL